MTAADALAPDAIARALIADFDREVALTRRTLEAIPADRLDFRPHPRSWTLAELAGHIAETPSWTPGWQQDEMDFAALDGYAPVVPSDRDDLLRRFDDNVRSARELLGGFDDERMRAKWVARMGEQVLIDCPRAESMRTVLIHHWIQHRGQLQVYLRLCDAPVPPTYGPTADVAEWS